MKQQKFKVQNSLSATPFVAENARHSLSAFQVKLNTSRALDPVRKIVEALTKLTCRLNSTNLLLDKCVIAARFPYAKSEDVKSIRVK